MRKLLIMLSLFLISVILSACGGGGGGGSGSGGGSGGAGNVTNKGVVIADLTAYDVTVCYDRDQNKQCDVNDPAGRVNDDGSYEITDATENDITNVALIAEFRTKIYRFSAPSSAPVFILEAPKGKALISTFTTLVKNIMDSDASYSLAQAENKVKSNMGESTDLDLYSKNAYNDELKKLNDQCVIIVKSLVEKANENSMVLNPALISLISNIITETITQIMDLISNDTADIDRIITQEKNITEDDLIKYEEKLDEAKNSRKFNALNAKSYSYRIEHHDGNTELRTDVFAFTGKSTFRDSSDRVLIKDYNQLVLGSEKTMGITANISEAIATPVKAKNMLELYLSLNPDEYPDLNAFIENYGTELTVKLRSIQTDFPENAAIITVTYSPTSIPSFTEVQSGNINHARLRDDEIWFDQDFQQNISSFKEAVDSMENWDRGGFLKVGWGKYSVKLEPDMNGIITYHDSSCVANSGYRRDNACMRFSKFYENFQDHIEIRTDTEVTFIWFGESRDGDRNYKAVRAESFPNLKATERVITLNEHAMEYLSKLTLSVDDPILSVQTAADAVRNVFTAYDFGYDKNGMPMNEYGF